MIVFSTVGNVANVSLLFFQYGMSEVSIVFNTTQLSLSFNMDAWLIVDESRSSHVHVMLNPSQASIQLNPMAVSSSNAVITTTSNTAIVGSSSSDVLASVLSTINSMTPLVQQPASSNILSTRSLPSPTISLAIPPSYTCISTTDSSSASMIGTCSYLLIVITMTIVAIALYL